MISKKNPFVQQFLSLKEVNSSTNSIVLWMNIDCYLLSKHLQLYHNSNDMVQVVMCDGSMLDSSLYTSYVN